MAKAIKMPDLGTTVDTITLIEWKVKPGDAVKRGEPLAAIETDKAVTELESVGEGTVLKLLVEDGEEIEVGTVIAYIGEAGESVVEAALPADAKVEEADASEAKPAAFRKQPADSPRVSPVVRNLATKMGVDLAKINGTGRHGMITREDVLGAAKTGPVGH
jgi:pyruvate dehydrogenase E2 component (dihydrolipoamide acetyltransferase)